MQTLTPQLEVARCVRLAELQCTQPAHLEEKHFSVRTSSLSGPFFTRSKNTLKGPVYSAAESVWM